MDLWTVLAADHKIIMERHSRAAYLHNSAVKNPHQDSKALSHSNWIRRATTTTQSEKVFEMTTEDKEDLKTLVDKGMSVVDAEAELVLGDFRVESPSLITAEAMMQDDFKDYKSAYISKKSTKGMSQPYKFYGEKR